MTLYTLLHVVFNYIKASNLYSSRDSLNGCQRYFCLGRETKAPCDISLECAAYKFACSFTYLTHLARRT